jgi:small subunit ribosomal protein S21
MVADGAQETTTAENAPAEKEAPEEKPVQTARQAEAETEASDSEQDRRPRRRERGTGDAVFCRPLEVVVRDDRVEQAIRQLKNRMAREGVLRELKNRRHYFKPSELKRIKSREAARRRRKQARQKGGR